MMYAATSRRAEEANNSVNAICSRSLGEWIAAVQLKLRYDRHTRHEEPSDRNPASALHFPGERAVHAAGARSQRRAALDGGVSAPDARRRRRAGPLRRGAAAH